MIKRATIGPRTVTVNGAHWKAGAVWDGFCWERAEVREMDYLCADYHLAVPWAHPNDPTQKMGDLPIYRLRLKRGWKRFVRVDGVWMVEKGQADV